MLEIAAASQLPQLWCLHVPAYPNVAPASGGERVEYVDRSSPLWAVLREQWKLHTVPDFLKHLFNKHDGEARLFGEASCIPLAADVREPCFWSYQLARTSETRQWLAERETLSPPQKLTIGQVHWVLDQQRGGSTLLIHRVRDAASGATRFLIRSGRVPLARIGWKCARMDLPMTHSPKKRQRRT